MSSTFYKIIASFLLIFSLIACTQKSQENSSSTIEATNTGPEPTKPEETEVWEPQPKIITPVYDNSAPSDAIVLFDGAHLKQWESSKDGTKAQWTLNDDGSMTVNPGTGDIQTKESFGSIQLHIEWRTPEVTVSEGQGRGNSGIFFQDRYEIQILDNFRNKTYANGQAGSVYKQTSPLVNASRKNGEWQSYDIIFNAPEFNGSGEKIKSGHFTVFHNGVLIQNHTEILGTTEYIGWPKNDAHGKAPIKLQDHSNLISYRNIWLREL